jgi:hypothetical protein
MLQAGCYADLKYLYNKPAAIAPAIGITINSQS